MGANTKIEWCDHTFNPWTGCTKVSPGCANCYAEGWSKRSGIVEWGPGKPRRRTSAANWREPLKWNREASGPSAVGRMLGEGTAFAEEPRRPRVFCASLADWLDDDGVPIEWVSDLFALIRVTRNLDWLLLTKRPHLWRSRLEAVAKLGDIGAQFAAEWLVGRAPSNVWIGTTVEDQTRADERIPELLKIPARVRFLSCEPLLGPLALYGYTDRVCSRCGGDGCDPELWHPARHPIQMDPDPCRECCLIGRGIHWVICGGESGPKARPMHPDWARSLRDQCSAAGVAFHFKQWGEWSPVDGSALQQQCCGVSTITFPLAGRDVRITRAGKKSAGRLLDGREHNDLPEVRA